MKFAYITILILFMFNLSCQNKSYTFKQSKLDKDGISSKKINNKAKKSADVDSGDSNSNINIDKSLTTSNDGTNNSFHFRYKHFFYQG